MIKNILILFLSFNILIIGCSADDENTLEKEKVIPIESLDTKPLEVVKVSIPEEVKPEPKPIEKPPIEIEIPTPNIFAKEVLPCDSSRFTTQYDDYFRKYTKRYFGPGYQWKWFKSQGIAESGLDANAKSWVGAEGVMQVMPKTREEIVRKQSWIEDTTDPKWNIAQGVYYDNYLWKEWASPRTHNDRVALMLGCYNAGLGNPLKAQKICSKDTEGEYNGFPKCNSWKYIRLNAHNVSTWIHEESLGYVDKIFALMSEEY